METIRKTAKFGRGTKELFHERFSNYKEFYDVLMERQNHNPHQSLKDVFDSHDKSWLGVDSVEQAQDLFLNGWQQNVEKLKVAFKKELDVLEHNKPSKMVNSVAGFMPIVPNALLGLPNSMIDVRIERRKSRILSFCVSIDRACFNSTEEIIKSMSKQFAYIAMLERSGVYRCRIEVFFTGYSGSDGNSKRIGASASVLVKSEDQLFDIKRLCFPVIHPAMLRLFMFAWYESIPLQASEYLEGGYGRAFEHWDKESKKDFINFINQRGEKTICLDLKSDVAEVFGKEVANGRQ